MFRTPAFPVVADDLCSVGVAAKPKQRKGKLGTMCQKTKMCRYFLLGKCSRGATCHFAHDESELRPAPDLHGTKICPMFAAEGRCDLASCPFAHGREELRRVKLQLSDLHAQDPPTPETASGAFSDTTSETMSESTEHSLQPAAGQPTEAPPPPKEQQPGLVQKERLHKSKMCAYFQVGSCLKGESCNFAHCPEDLHAVGPDRLQRTGSGPDMRACDLPAAPNGLASASDPVCRSEASPTPPWRLGCAGSPPLGPKPAPPAAVQVLIATRVVVPPTTAIATMLPAGCMAAPGAMPNPVVSVPVRAMQQQAFFDPSLLPECPQSPFAETPIGAVACTADPFCMKMMMRGISKESQGVGSAGAHWMEDIDRWSDSECGLFEEDGLTADDE